MLPSVNKIVPFLPLLRSLLLLCVPDTLIITFSRNLFDCYSVKDNRFYIFAFARFPKLKRYPAVHLHVDVDNK